MHRTRNVVLPVLLLLVFLMNTPSVLCRTNVIPYINYTHWFSIHAPARWSWDESSDFVKKTPGGVIAFIGPHEGLFLNMFIGVEAVLNTVTIEVYFSRAKDAVKIAYPYFYILSEDRRTVNGLASCELTGEHKSYKLAPAPLTGSGGGSAIMQKQVYLMAKEKVYLVQLTAPSIYFDRYSLVFEESLQTFTLGLPWKTFLIPVLVPVFIVGLVAPALYLFYSRRKASKSARFDIKLMTIELQSTGS